MKTRFIGAAAMMAAGVVSSTEAALVQIRDAVGGEFANGNPGGPLLVGTGSHILGTTTDQSDGAVYTGTFDLEANYGSGFHSLHTYCIQPNEQLGFGYNPPDSVGLQYQEMSLASVGFTPTEANYIQRLWANAYAVSQTSRANAAAFQSIIWELNLDSTIDLTHGTFRMNPAGDSFTNQVYTIAQGWLNNLQNNVWTTSTDLVALSHPNSQDFLAPAVPGPGAAAMLIFGIGLVGRNRRRRDGYVRAADNATEISGAAVGTLFATQSRASESNSQRNKRPALVRHDRRMPTPAFN